MSRNVLTIPRPASALSVVALAGLLSSCAALDRVLSIG
jgi:hypothetical protein